MKRTINVLGWTMLASLTLAVVLVIAAMATAGSVDPMTIRIDGEQIDMANFGVFDGLLAIGGVAIGLLVTLLVVGLVVPLAVLIPLAIVAVVLVGVLLLLAGVFAVVFSPLIFAVLAVWLIVKLIRRGERKSPAMSSATIAG